MHQRLVACLAVVLLAAITPPARASAGAPGEAPPAAPAEPESGAFAEAVRLMRLEAETELACDRHFRPRPCRERDGSTGYQCVIKSPFAAALHWLGFHEDTRTEDREVVRVVLRPASQSAAAASAHARATALNSDLGATPALASGTDPLAAEARVSRPPSVLVRRSPREECRRP